MSLPRFGLFMVGLMGVMPELCYRHDYPVSSFHQEWIAAFFGLLALMPLAARDFWKAPEVPRIALLPAGMLVLVVVQFALGRIPYLGQGLLFGLYFLWAGLLAILGRYCRQTFGLPHVSLFFAAFLLLGAELSALAGLLQHYRWHTFLDGFIALQTSAAVYGNLAQPNHFADYVCLGLVSLGLIHARLSWNWRAVPFAVPLLYVLVLSGSRSSWLYLVGMMAMAWLAGNKSLLKYSLLLIAGFALLHFTVPWGSAPAGSVTSAGRLFAGASGGSIRLHLWHEAWMIFISHPLLGAGFGQYAWQHFSLGPVLKDPVIVGPYDNAHNIVMQLAAETGLLGLFLFFATLLWWGRQSARVGLGIDRWWAFSLLAVLGIHSLLEYPLWFAHFLGIFAFVIGMLDETFWKIELRGRVLVYAMLLLGCVALLQVYSDYRKLEALMEKRKGEADVAYYERAKSAFGKVAVTSPMRPYAELAMSALIEVSPNHLGDKLYLNSAVMRFLPIAPVAYRQAQLLALSGRGAAAEKAMARALWSYPADYPQVRREMTVLAKRYPGQFLPLISGADLEHGNRFRIAPQP